VTSPAAPELTNPRSERVKAVRALSGRSVRLRTGRFLVEGPQSVREAVRETPARVRDVYLTGSAAERYGEIVDAAEAGRVRVHTASDEVLAAMSPDAQGVLAVAETHDPGLTAVLDSRPRLVAVLAQVRDPGNAGTVIRAADAAGADAVVLTADSVDVHNPKVVRSTAGSLFHLPVTAGLPLAEVTAALRAAGMTVLAADGAGEHDLDDLQDAVVGRGTRTDVPDLTRPTAWVFGNEAWGLRPADRALADAVVRVPIRGRAESLNLATAATVCLYASSRAQR
jgi:RNA methyltransferase, TrmH family